MVKRYGVWSMGLIILGIVLFGLSLNIENQVEMTFLFGIISCLIGTVFGFVAIAKQEEGILKFISIGSFFIVLFLISCFEPFQFVRVLAWLKNMA